MLVLSRKVGETIQIAESVTLKVISINGTRVKLGFEGTPNVPILRGELVNDYAEVGFEDDTARLEPCELELLAH
jgi:carbon storage regulator